MDKFVVFGILIVCLCKHGSSVKLPGPLVYVVTASPAHARAAQPPFYYHDWRRRMDPPQNATTTTPKPHKLDTPDLIFAEFESGNKMKSIRKLLEKEKVEPTTSTSSRPIYVPEESMDAPQNVSPMETSEEKKEDAKVDMTDYFAFYNNLYNPNSEAQTPVYRPPPSTSTTREASTTSKSTPSPGPGVENIWHIIDSQKYDQYPGKWQEEPVTSDDDRTTTSEPTSQPDDDSTSEDQEKGQIDDDFALPGFATNPGNGAENESRAIRTEPNMRFPYINLKPFQMKTQRKPPINSISNSKKGSTMYTSLDNFHDVKNPVRGEAQDVVPMRQPVDRYNPAQPYLPDYGSKSKQSSPNAPPSKAVANLVPPPPPPRPSGDDFPAPSSYEAFPPYAPSGPSAPSFPSSAPKPSMLYQTQTDTSDDQGPDTSSDSDGPLDLGYRYKPPSPPIQPFLPTIPPMTKPSGGNSYDKPPMSYPSGGYSYNKPMPKPFAGYSYDKPPMADDPTPDAPSPPQDNAPASYGQDVPSYGIPDYSDQIYNKPQGGMKGGDDTKDMGMAPPPPPADMDSGMDQGPQSDDQGFPHDFPDDQKYHYGFDVHDHDFHHHHHPTTTTTTETPRVNRYSYYYLGKKLYYLPLYFSVYFIVYVGALIIKAVLRHKIVYPNSWRPNDQTSTFFSKRSVDSWNLSNDNLHEITGKVTHAIAVAGEKYFTQKKKK